MNYTIHGPYLAWAGGLSAQIDQHRVLVFELQPSEALGGKLQAVRLPQEEVRHTNAIEDLIKNGCRTPGRWQGAEAP